MRTATRSTQPAVAPNSLWIRLLPAPRAMDKLCPRRVLHRFSPTLDAARNVFLGGSKSNRIARMDFRFLFHSYDYYPAAM